MSNATASQPPTPNALHSTQRHLGRRFWALACAIALPLPLVSCFNNKALLPLQAACEGQGVADAAAYEPDAAKPPIATLVSRKGRTTVQSQYLADDVTTAKTVAEAQLVACIDFQDPIVVERCTYTGAGISTLKRFGRKAEVKLVAAQTGEVLKTELMLEEPPPCSESETFRQGETEKAVTAEIKAFKAPLQAWIPEAIANPNASGTPTGESLPLGQQCEALTDAMESEVLWIGAAIEYGIIDPAEADTDVRVAVSMGLDATERTLPEIARSTVAINAAPVNYDELATVKASFLENLTGLDQSLTRFQELSQAAEPLAPHGQAIDRESLKPIGEEMKTLAEEILKHDKSMQKLFEETTLRCLELEKIDS